MIPGYLAFASDDRGNVLFFDTEEEDNQQIYRMPENNLQCKEAVRLAVGFYSLSATVLMK